MYTGACLLKLSFILLHMHVYKHTCKFGETALHFAVHQEHEDIVELLLEAHADPDLKKVITVAIAGDILLM